MSYGEEKVVDPKSAIRSFFMVAGVGLGEVLFLIITTAILNAMLGVWLAGFWFVAVLIVEIIASIVLAVKLGFEFDTY